MSILPQLEHDLYKAAQERLRVQSATSTQPPSRPRRSRFRRLRAPVAHLPVLLSVAAAIAIAAIALTAFRHSHGSVPPTSTGGSLPRASSPRAELIQTIELLRRPQVTADLNRSVEGLYPASARAPRGSHAPLPRPRRALARWGYPELDVPLLRVVSIPAWGAKVLIAPTTYQPSRSRHRSEGINLAIQIPGSGLTGTGPKPATATSFVTHGLSVFTNAQNGTNRGALLVPDGIAKVTLDSFRLPPHSAPSGLNPNRLAAATAGLHATAAVHDNIAALQLAIPEITIPRGLSGLFGMPATAQAIWSDPNGRVIRRTTTGVDLLVRISALNPTRVPHGRR
jgi:hypothetical protein